MRAMQNTITDSTLHPLTAVAHRTKVVTNHRPADALLCRFGHGKATNIAPCTIVI